MCTKLLSNEKIQITSSIDTGKENDDIFISLIITGVKNSIQQEKIFEGGVIHLLTNGSRTQVYAINRRSSSANINYQQVS